MDHGLCDLRKPILTRLITFLVLAASIRCTITLALFTLASFTLALTEIQTMYCLRFQTPPAELQWQAPCTTLILNEKYEFFYKALNTSELVPTVTQVSIQLLYKCLPLLRSAAFLKKSWPGVSCLTTRPSLLTNGSDFPW